MFAFGLSRAVSELHGAGKTPLLTVVQDNQSKRIGRSNHFSIGIHNGAQPRQTPGGRADIDRSTMGFEGTVQRYKRYWWIVVEVLRTPRLV